MNVLNASRLQLDTNPSRKVNFREKSVRGLNVNNQTIYPQLCPVTIIIIIIYITSKWLDNPKKGEISCV